MMGFWEFWNNHCFLAFVAILVTGEVLIKIIRRLLRTINILFKGWPPDHLDADGDWPKLEIREEEQ